MSKWDKTKSDIKRQKYFRPRFAISTLSSEGMPARRLMAKLIFPLTSGLTDRNRFPIDRSNDRFLRQLYYLCGYATMGDSPARDSLLISVAKVTRVLHPPSRTPIVVKRIIQNRGYVLHLCAAFTDLLQSVSA